MTNKIASVGADDRICIYNADVDKEVKLICKVEKGHAADINGVTWHPKEKNILATCGDDYVVKIWNLQKKKN